MFQAQSLSVLPLPPVSSFSDGISTYLHLPSVFDSTSSKRSDFLKNFLPKQHALSF